MTQITGAIIGITLVLVAVFIPMAFFPGSVGVIYRQFSITMVSAIAFSALLALSLTPALCATLLNPVAAGHHHSRRGLFGLFGRASQWDQNIAHVSHAVTNKVAEIVNHLDLDETTSRVLDDWSRPAK
jgi:multidrug efflux pump subunit AcrB